MPYYIRDASLENGLMEAYRNRPDYQQNDYVGWITRAKRDETKKKRLSQMLDELKKGDKYMVMDYLPKRSGYSQDKEDVIPTAKPVFV
ncbi:YdeI/OmpD-associated family protein [candidate division WOR-3 bacterium]|nr:YdeI/OmpD-associated family protein [candidate division WOR-3 bacterium]